MQWHDVGERGIMLPALHRGFRTHLLRAATVLTCFAVAFIAAKPTSASQTLSPQLTNAISSASPIEYIPLVVLFSNPIAIDELENDDSTGPGLKRRALLIEPVKARFKMTSGLLMERLRELETAGLAKDIRPIWMANAVAAEVASSSISQLEEVCRGARLDLDERRNVLQDQSRESSVGSQSLPDEHWFTAVGDTAWGVKKIGAPEAWADGITGEGVLVAILDTGVLYTHSDLQNRIWNNPGEIQGNLIDDDANGYVDDYMGYDFVSDDGDPLDDLGHGTHVAGTICGDGTGGRRTGVAPGARLMICKVIDSIGQESESEIWEGIQYAFENGADVLNLSYGWKQEWGPNRATWRTICDYAAAAGVIMCVAAGNERAAGPADR